MPPLLKSEKLWVFKLQLEYKLDVYMRRIIRLPFIIRMIVVAHAQVRRGRRLDATRRLLDAWFAWSTRDGRTKLRIIRPPSKINWANVVKFHSTRHQDF